MKKNKPNLPSEKMLFIIAILVIALPLITYHYFGPGFSAPKYSSEISDKEPYVPFKKKENKVTTNADGTATVLQDTYEVELTPQEEEQYYGDYPEYAGWTTAYDAETLYRYPPGWGYFGFTAMLRNEDTGANSRTVVSLYFGRGEQDERDPLDNIELAHATIGHTYTLGKVDYKKVENIVNITGTTFSKYISYPTENLIEIRYFAEEPNNQHVRLYVNAMNREVYEKNIDTIDSIVRSMIYVPYEYR